VDTYSGLVEVLDKVVPTLPDRTEPLLLEVSVVPDVTFEP
jgi:benzoylformate decarboxylase